MKQNVTNALGNERDEPRDPLPGETQKSEWIPDIYRVLGITKDWVRTFESGDPILVYVVDNWSTLDDIDRQFVKRMISDRVKEKARST